MSDETITDEQVLANPADFTVAQVTDVFLRSTPDQVAATKAIEGSGKNRAGIMDWSAPVIEDPDEIPEGSFSRERVLSYDEGPRIAGEPFHVIAGALASDQRAHYSREEIAELVAQFRSLKPEEA